MSCVIKVSIFGKRLYKLLFSIDFSRIFVISYFYFYRVTQEGKERRRLWAQRKTQQSSAGGGAVEVSENKLHQETQDTLEMLPNDIVNLLASREKYAMLLFPFCGLIYVLPFFFFLKY